MSEQETDTVDMDALFATSLDADAAAKAESQMLLPVGSYQTVPPYNTTVKKYEAQGDPESDDYKAPRVVCRTFGAIANSRPIKDTLGNDFAVGEKTGRIGFQFSPEAFTKNGDYDRSYKNYVMLFRAYTNAYGQKPASLSDLVEYLNNYPVELRVIQLGTQADATGEPGNMVVAISAVKG